MRPLHTAEVPSKSEAGIVVSALFFKGFTHVVDFLARAYGDLGFGTVAGRTNF
jgi:hypothetical protein